MTKAYLVVLTNNSRDIHVVCGAAQLFVFLVGEDINTNKMDLGTTVLTSLRGAHVDNFARVLLNQHKTSFTKRGALSRGGERGHVDVLRKLRNLQFRK